MTSPLLYKPRLE